ncbi:MAG: BLUF domain-containing protein [Acidimicrobiales bacterium]
MAGRLAPLGKVQRCSIPSGGGSPIPARTEDEAGIDLWQVVYVSAASPEFAPAELENILQVARRRNADLEITGMLLFADKSFLQVLEGERERLDQLFTQIQRDERHRRTLLLIREPIERRSFADWTMGAATASLGDLQDAVGTNDFFQSRDALFTLTDAKLRQLLEMFRSGTYRQKIL